MQQEVTPLFPLQLSFLSHTMPMSTCKSNANAHPGRVVLESQTVRRTTKEIQEDKAHKVEAAIAQREEEESRNKCIAEVEDAIERNEDQLRTHANRPDLRYEPMRGGTKEEEEIPPNITRELDKEDEDEDEDAYSPLASTVFNTSSDPDDDGPASMNDPEIESKSQVLPDGNEDGGNRMEVDIPNPQDRCASVAQVRKKKAKEVALRAAVNVHRTVPNASSLKEKHKASPEVPQGGPKRLKQSNAIGGLSANWKSKVSHSQQIVKKKLQSNTTTGSMGSHSQDSEGIFCPGKFDSDKDEDMLEKVKASKGTMPIAPTGRSARYIRLMPAALAASDGSMAWHTAQMHVKLMKIMSPPDRPDHQATNAMGSSGVDDDIVEISVPSQKQKYTKADLSFPCGGNHRQIWAKNFRAALLSWAGSQDDPFGASGVMHGEILRIWECLYPDIELDTGSKNMEIVVYVCDTLLTSWRSGIGKTGITIVENLWDSNDTKYGRDEQRKKYTKKLLGGLKYLYEFPNEVPKHGAFRSKLVSQVLSTHLKKVVSEVNSYGPQVGAAALAAVAVERGLSLYEETGANIRKAETTSDGSAPSCVYDFGESPWGFKLRDLTERSKGLSAEAWESIMNRALEYLNSKEKEVMKGKRNRSGDDGNTVATSLHANIDLDW